MEKTEQDDTTEVFQECDDNNYAARKQSKDSFKPIIDTLSSEDQKLRLCDLLYYKQNNNHHIVPVGVIIVIITILLGTTSLQKCLVTCVENTHITEHLQQQDNQEIINYLQKPENLENSQILERLLEYKGICKDLQIFTKAIEQNHHVQINDEKEKSNDILKDIEVIAVNGKQKEDNELESEDDSDSSASGNGDSVKAARNKYKKSKYYIKTTNTKSGFNKHNKSTKAKYHKNQKKELNITKKNSTAEPIIYLFALVFIYLLLKAASDISHHYKSQNKNDKRLRRCSLQSYAQTHRSDRRASKGITAKSLPKF